MASAGRGDVAAQLIERLAVIGAAVHGSVQAEAVDVGAKVLLEVRLPGHGALYRQHLLASTRTEGDTVRAGRGLQRPEVRASSDSASLSAT